jgi:hypothetical protein
MTPVGDLRGIAAQADAGEALAQPAVVAAGIQPAAAPLHPAAAIVGVDLAWDAMPVWFHSACLPLRIARSKRRASPARVIVWCSATHRQSFCSRAAVWVCAAALPGSAATRLANTTAPHATSTIASAGTVASGTALMVRANRNQS